MHKATKEAIKAIQSIPGGTAHGVRCRRVAQALSVWRSVDVSDEAAAVDGEALRHAVIAETGEGGDADGIVGLQYHMERVADTPPKRPQGGTRTLRGYGAPARYGVGGCVIEGRSQFWDDDA